MTDPYTNTGRNGKSVQLGVPFELRPEVLAEFRRSIAEASSIAVADEVLFKLGRTWGASEARALGLEDGEKLSMLQRGIGRVEELELGKVWLDEFEHSADDNDCCIKVRVIDPFQMGQGSASEPPPNGATCGLTIGLVTGLASVVTRMDVTSTPFQCSGCCGRSGCTFEIRPAHTWATPHSEPQPPSGSARFFLHSLGRRMSEGDISLADLVENTSDAIVLIDDDDTIRFWNRGAEELFCYPREEVVGRKIGFILPQDLIDIDELGWIKSKIGVDGVLSNFITRRIRKDGLELSVSLTRTVLHDSQGRVVGSTAIIRDVTEHLEAKKELSRTNHLARIGELAANVAHEIKNPLTGIYTAIQILSRSLSSDDQRKPIFEDIGAEIRRLDQLAMDLLRFSSPLVPKTIPTDLAAFLSEALKSPGLATETEGHRLELEVPEDCFVPIEVNLMLPVIHNIVLNAAHAMDDGGLIHLSAEESNGHVTIAIRDTGPGIPEDRLETIYEPFYTEKARGTGLGLSIARKNVEAHGGTIWAENTPTAGARFVIRLPAVTMT